MFGLGSYITNFIGGCCRWAWGQIRLKLFGGPKFTFNEYLNGPNNGDEIIDTYGHGCINHVIGIVVLMILIVYVVDHFIL
jgi:hypothetical protein